MLINKSVKNIIVVFVVLVLLAGVIFASVKREPDSQDDAPKMSLRNYILSSFINELPDINSKLPFQIDANTVLLSIEYVNGKVLSRYKMLNYRSTIESNQKFIKEVAPRLKKQACLDEVKKRLIDVDVEFLSSYQDSKGSVIFEVNINRSTCSAFNSVE